MLGKQDRIVLDTLLPAQSDAPLSRGIFDAGFDAFHQDFNRQANRTWRLSFRASLWVAAWISPLLIKRTPPLSLHEPAVRERALTALGSSRHGVLRQMYFVLKTVAAFCYGTDSDVRSTIGLPPSDDPVVPFP